MTWKRLHFGWLVRGLLGRALRNILAPALASKPARIAETRQTAASD